MRFAIAIWFLIAGESAAQWLLPTITTVSGSKKPDFIFPGQLVFEDKFDYFDDTTWQHEKYLAAATAWEFQWYDNSSENCYTEFGNLHIKPTLTSEYIGEEALMKSFQTVDGCTRKGSCEKQGTPKDPINPIRSARIRSSKSFAFKHGILEVRAKMPAGDWLFPAIWLLPAKGVYGGWPVSGEIDLVEVRGNRRLFSGSTNVGNEQMGSTLHFGPSSAFNGWRTAHYAKNEDDPSFSDDFHIYMMIWTPEYLEFRVDNELVGRVSVYDGFWKRGNFGSSGLPNPWINGTIAAPFDEEFYIVINLAVGGLNYFSDSFKNEESEKPWLNTSPTPIRDFLNAKEKWLATWDYNNSDDSHLQVDFVRVWAL